MYQIADTNYAINAKQFKDFRWIRMHICKCYNDINFQKYLR